MNNQECQTERVKWKWVQEHDKRIKELEEQTVKLEQHITDITSDYEELSKWRGQQVDKLDSSILELAKKCMEYQARIAELESK